jgi:hypothetical protein
LASSPTRLNPLCSLSLNAMCEPPGRAVRLFRASLSEQIQSRFQSTHYWPYRNLDGRCSE